MGSRRSRNDDATSAAQQSLFGRTRGGRGGRARDAPAASVAANDLASLRHRRFVGLMKLLLPALALAIVALVVAWPKLVGTSKRFRIEFASTLTGDAQSLRMVRPRFTGVDGSDRPFTVTADAATRVAPQSELIDLERPQADITLAGGAWVTLSATEGTYDQVKHGLDLRREVNLFHDAGYEFHTSQAHLDLAAGTAQGDEPVEGQGPFGHLKAQGFHILDRGAVVTFKGPSTLVLYPGAGKRPQ
ncbi:MAG: LPS export ABC transporter periplasmic protein LptC [Alphaproteobacteria bacterium]